MMLPVHWLLDEPDPARISTPNGAELGAPTSGPPIRRGEAAWAEAPASSTPAVRRAAIRAAMRSIAQPYSIARMPEGCAGPMF